jgi:hydrogenase maturation protease
MGILVVGIGQSLRGDDAAGLAAVQFWQEAYPESANHPAVRVEQIELPGLSLLDELDGPTAAILVDAVRSGGKPGSLHLLGEDDLSTFGAGTGSAHGMGVAETLALGRRLYPGVLPSTIVLVGIEAGELGLGEALSPEVSQALPAAARAIESQLQTLINREIRE